MTVINILLGAALLFFGRRLFWLFVAGVGFVAGVMLATAILGSEPQWLAVLIGLGVGLIGALLSVFLQELVVAVAGFLAGAYLFYTVAFALGFGSFAWLAFLVGGVIGTLLVLALFDWALIGLSALIGATLIVQNLALERTLSVLAFVGLAAFGIVVQARQFRGTPPRQGVGVHVSTSPGRTRTQRQTKA
jgi:hypothetical protein